MDDKDNPSPDPWAGIDAEGSAEGAEGFEFSFDDPAEPVSEQPTASQTPDDPLGEDDVIPMGEIDVDSWLAEPVAEADDDAVPGSTNHLGSSVGASDVPFGVFSMDDSPSDETPSPEAGASSQGDDIDPWEATDSTLFAGIDDDEAPVADGDLPADIGLHSTEVEIGTGHSGVLSSSDVIPTESADDVVEDGWNAEITSGEEPVTQFEDGFETGEPEPSPPVLISEPKPEMPRRRRGGGIGQLVGIALGGLMALPITYAILIWGLQKDPLKLAPAIPESLAGLLPEKLRPGNGPGAAVAPRPNLDQVPAFDPEPAAEPPAAKPQPTETPAASNTLAETEFQTEAKTEAAMPAKPTLDEIVATAPAEPAIEPAAVPEQPMPKPDLAANETVAAIAPMETVAAPPAAVEPVAPAPLDTSALDAAVAKAVELQDALVAVGDDPEARRKPLVAWYRGLANVAEQLTMLEKVALDTGRPLDELPPAIATLHTRLSGSAATLEDLTRLGAMWMTSKKRPADGAVLVARFDGARQVGPYWSSTVTLEGGQPLALSIISRRAPSASAGEQVLVSGLLLDGDVIWAADCSRLEKPAAPAEDLF